MGRALELCGSDDGDKHTESNADDDDDVDVARVVIPINSSIS